MKIPDNYIKELVQAIAGEAGVNLVFYMKDKENISEFKIAEKLRVTVNEVRNTLYKLQDKNLVFFTRKKDQKKGWYIYYWTFDMPKARNLLIDMKRQHQQHLQKVIAEETPGSVYVCQNKCVRLRAEEALEHQFKCPECDTVLSEEDLSKRKEKMTREIEQLQQQIHELSQIELLSKKEEKKKKGKLHKMHLKKQKKKMPSKKIKPGHHPLVKKVGKKELPKRSFFGKLKSKFRRR